MNSTITQRVAKALVRDYLRETGRKGVVSLMAAIRRQAKTEIFAQRTLELWLKEQNRFLQDAHWSIVIGFIESQHFKNYVPYAHDSPTEKRLITVAEGLVALYGQNKRRDDGVFLLSSHVQKMGQDAIKLLAGNWENVPNLKDRDIPRTMCAIEPVHEKRYAKFAYIALFRSKQISTTGLVLYLNSEERESADYCHQFVLHLWRRKDPETGSTMPGELIYLTLSKNQPELSISNVVNQYFYKSTDAVAGDAVILRLSRQPIRAP